MIVLGLESSCDETGVALYCTKRGLLAHTLFSQIKMHAQYGGVVPELASRDHIHRVLPLIEEALAQADLDKNAIDGVAYTQGPGLMGALLVGASVAKSLAYGLGVPALGVHHMEGHLLAPMLETNKPAFPFVALLVSGGHTLLAAVHGIGQYCILGESVDDAAGEAFDKTAKIMNLGYPGGPALAALAVKGAPSEIQFPRPMVKKPNLDFSFSGLKTAALLAVQAHDETRYPDIAYAFEQAVVDTLMIKSKRALKQTGFTQLVVAGGVGANQTLREKLKTTGHSEGFEVFYPSLEFCTDNGAMIALVGALRLEVGQVDADLSFMGTPRWAIDTLNPI